MLWIEDEQSMSIQEHCKSLNFPLEDILQLFPGLCQALLYEQGPAKTLWSNKLWSKKNTLKHICLKIIDENHIALTFYLKDLSHRGICPITRLRSKVFSLERRWIKLLALKGFGLVGLEHKTKKNL